jgi:hypothetical protein
MFVNKEFMFENGNPTPNSKIYVVNVLPTKNW